MGESDYSCKLIMAAAKTLDDKTIWEGDESLGEEVLRMSTEEVISRTRLLDNEVKIMKSEVMRISHELQSQKEKIKENAEKIKVNKTLPYLVSNVIELLDVDPQDLGEEDGANVDLDSHGKGKTLLARACAAQTKSTFLKLAGPQLVQMFIGDGAKLVRDAFALAKEKAPAIIFIDELDAIGTKRFDSEKAGDREVQRTMLELLNQLDGFEPSNDIKVIAATNRVDILDPALLRSGRLDRKIDFPKPDQEARARIMQILSRKMNVSSEVNFDELSRCCDDFNGAQLKAVCVEAGMIALRREATIVTHEDFMDAILEVQAKKKQTLNYYA